ncbi:MAG: hypothetical protein DCC44_05045 [Acidobacteria bacterium]|nr:hypothetical protein [Pyrinomonadaceae bacterium]RIJ94203.1 MAG: hypothetical protein DCC44_05045 [Acidobacteriota bacterium]
MEDSISVSTTEYTSFDILGRVTAHKQTTDGTAYSTGYIYNLSGALIEETYPSGRVVKNTLDEDGSLSQVHSKRTAGDILRPYATNFTYNAAGAITQMRLGNGRWESTQFNSRLQPVQIGLGSGPTAQNLLKLDYEYGATAAVNNGNVTKQTITVPTVGANTGFTAVQSYTYDEVNRLKGAVENVTPTGGSASQSWRQAFTFDRYGNRNFDEENSTTLPKNCGTAPNLVVCEADRKVVNPSADAANNRFAAGQGWSYDAAGNTIADANGQTYIYDAENKMVTASNASGTLGQYTYDGDGKRVKKVVPSTGETTVFAYDASGKMVAEYSTNVEPVATAKVNYLTTDHLGSPRINTDGNGSVTARHDYHPFGEEIDGVGGRTAGLNYGDDTIRKQFTGYERDTETSLDFAEARMYGSNRGRFLSTDPRTYGSVFEPGTWNHYVYGLNNPYSFVDQKGRWPEWIHRMITDWAFPGLSAEEINQIHRGNRRIDYDGALPDTMNPKKSFQHTMYNTTYNPPGIMEVKRQEFIDSQLAIAKDPLNRDNNGFPNEAANEAFGASRHPPQDAASPAHSGDNSYYDTPSPIAWFLGGGTAVAFAYGMWRHHQIESTITREQLDVLVREERAAYRNAFGNANYERATRSLLLFYIVPTLKNSRFPSDSGQKKEEGAKETGWEPCPGFVPTKEMTGCRMGPIENVD